MKQLRIPAVYMRGGTSKGVFFDARDLPGDAGQRDALLMRVIGSPDPYRQQIDGMGGATSSTSKVVILSPSERDDSDVDYRFGQVSIDRPIIDWSGNCGNLTAAVGPVAIEMGLVDASADAYAAHATHAAHAAHAAHATHATVRIWQANIRRRILAHVPIRAGAVCELGDFQLDGVTFPAAEVRLEFLDPGNAEGAAMFPTGSPCDLLDVPGVGRIEATLINAGNPTVFIAASVLGLSGVELQPDVNGNPDLLARMEAIRSCAAVAMGLAMPGEDVAATRPAIPKLAFVSPSADYTASDGRPVKADSVHLLARIVSMGRLHHAMTGTGGIAIAAAAAIPGTLVHRAAGGVRHERLTFGHPSGTLAVGADCERVGANWRVSRVQMSRSARRLMTGWVYAPPLPAPGGP